MRVKNLLKALPIGIILSSFCFAAYASSELDAIMKARGLSEKDILAAAKTYQPSGRKDEYLVFSSGGQSGQVIVYGVPSMRIYKYIAVFTPEPWQGYGYDEESTPTTQPLLKRTVNTPATTFSSMTKPILA